MHTTITAKTRAQSWERLSSVPACIRNPEFLRILVSYEQAPLARAMGPMSLILRRRHWDHTDLQHVEVPNPEQDPVQVVLIGSCRAEGVYCECCEGEVEDGEAVFIEMRDGEHGPFCSENCSDHWALNHDDREGPDVMGRAKGE